MGTDDPKPATTTPAPTGHPKGFFFLFAGEFAERFSFYGMRAILPLYLSDQMGYGEADGMRYYSYFLGLCYFLPLLGGWIADNLFGKYWTIVGFSLPYVLGQFLVGFENPYLLVLSLGLLAMGTGVIKPNISTLMGITYDQQRPGQDKLRSNAFQYFYMSINIGAFLSTLIVPQVRDMTGSYLMAFMVPAVFMVVALGLFAAGKKFYGIEANVRNRPKDTPEQTVTKLRVLGQVGLLFLLVTFFWAVFDQSSVTWVYFAKTYMDLNMMGYSLAPDSIQALNPFFIVVFIGGAAIWRSFAPASQDKKAAWSPTSKMLLGFLLTALCMGIMAMAGYQSGDPENAVVIKTVEGEIFVPLGTADLSSSTIDFAKKDDPIGNAGGAMKFPDGSPLRLTFGKYSAASPDEIRFREGDLTLADGRKLVFTNGRIDLTKSRDLFKDGPIELPGTLQANFKPNKRYQLEDGVLVIRRGNQAEFQVGATIPSSKAQEKPTITLGKGKYVKPENRVPIWWMVLAFLVITVAEILISVTGLELAFVVAPESMKGFITACWLFTVAIANWFINAPISDLYPAMHPGNYFVMLTFAGLVVAALFIPVSRRFNRAMEAAKQQQASLEGNSQID